MRVTAETVASQFHELRHDQEDLFTSFRKSALSFQRTHNSVYQQFSGYTYLPVEAFKRAEVCTFEPSEAEMVFESSRTGNSIPSQHFVKDLDIYRRSVLHGFTRVFGEEPLILVGHFPKYAPKSSLVYMMHHLIDTVGSSGSGFFLEDETLLRDAIKSSCKSGARLILFGAAFGLLDLLDKTEITLPPNAIVIETGGMKTHRKEIQRDEMHERLSSGFGIARKSIRSEYGMCELMSQFYTKQDGLFYAPPWAEFKILDPEDPLRELPPTQEGALAIFDLANIFSVSAILTEDRASRHGDGFKVHGRLSGAEIRGCNFLLEQ